MRETVRALLLTDIVDSTRLAEQSGARRASEIWSRHDRIARDLLEVHGGHEIDKTDGFLLLFESVGDAARHALAYHRALKDLSAELDVGLEARAGLHWGEVLLRENAPGDVARGAKPVELEGVAKPTAARVMAMAMGGQTLLTNAAAMAMDDALPAGAELESRGHWRLKGLAHPVELHEIGQRGVAPFQPPPCELKAYRVAMSGDLWLPLRDVPHSLPAERDTFVGRDAELQEIAQRFSDGARLLTVVGPGGTGKTRLATRYAWTWLGDYPGGAWFCDLSEARDRDGIVRALAATLGVPQGNDDPVLRLGQAIHARGRCLIVFDNFEQVAEHAGATLRTWLERAQGAHFLVTSRVLLSLLGEQVVPVEPLAVDGAAVELFECRARARRPGFAVTEENRADVLEVVQLLDGLPLAIELAAARTGVLSPRKLLDRLNDRFRLLAGASGESKRQATLRAAIDWSWELLQTWERAALAQASVFEGGFTLESSEAVLDLGAFPDAPWPLDAVQALVDKSLLRTWTPTHAGQRHDIEEPYFGMYVSIHEYAREKLRTKGAIENGGSGPAAEEDAFRRHGRHFASYGSDEVIAQLDTGAGMARRRALELELDNLLAACRRAVERDDGTIAVATFKAAWAVMELQGPFALACVIGERIESRCSLDPAELAELSATLGRACSRAGRSDEARSQLERARKLFRDLGNRRGEGLVIASQGRLYWQLGPPEKAVSFWQDALEILREVGDRRHEGVVVGNLGGVHHAQGRAAEARAAFEAAARIHQEVGDRRSEAVVLAGLGKLAFQEGRDALGHEMLEKALLLHREIGNRTFEGQTLSDLGCLLAELGRADESLAALAEGEAILRELGDAEELALLHCARAYYSPLNGSPEADARADVAAAEALARQVGAGPESPLGSAIVACRERLSDPTGEG